MDEIVVEGRRFISSKRAAARTGYAKDYIGQLARSRKVDARRVGRTWYVSEDSLRNLKQPVLEERRTPSRFMRDLDEIYPTLTYQSDSRPLLPRLEHVTTPASKPSVPMKSRQDELLERPKAVVVQKGQNRRRKRVKVDVMPAVTLLAVLAALGLGISHIERASKYTLGADGSIAYVSDSIYFATLVPTAMDHLLNAATTIAFQRK